MEYLVQIKDLTTGEVRDCPFKIEDQYAGNGAMIFQFFGHNHACDCNREFCFMEAGGEFIADDYDPECNGEGHRFVVMSIRCTQLDAGFDLPFTPEEQEAGSYSGEYYSTQLTQAQEKEASMVAHLL